MKKLLSLLILFYLSSCSSTNYRKENYVQTTGLDFSKGKWLLGNIEVDEYVRKELTELVLKDFTTHLKGRFTNYLNENSLLLPVKVPFNLTKSEILDLKRGTGYDFYINIKCQDERNDLSNFDYLAHSYYVKQMTFGRVFIEVYDLNVGEIIYRQGFSGAIDEDSGLSVRPKRKILLGCYSRLIKDIRQRSIGVSH